MAIFQRIMKKSAVQKMLVFSTALFASLSQAEVAKLAIIIDDIGYQPQHDAAIYAMPPQIGVAIIPVAPYAKQRNQQAKAQGRDVLIHLPMQPQAQMKIEAGGLTLGMSANEVAHRVQQAKQTVSFAIGLNNHMGSAATADSTLMQHLMSSLRQQNLAFLDSRTIGNSVAAKIAKSQGVKTLERHIFLDDSDVFGDVQRQFNQAIQYARKHGTAVVIGHPRKNTVAVLQQGLKNLPQDIQLVSIGSLWRNEKVPPPQPFILLFSELPAPTNVVPFQRVPLLRGMPE
ncbi:hypothetical protein A4G18_04535 [Pasteurellaceae bacterium Pebbles2]|nr:hypothetical protein [Pasteurellaceae bacterium Pebbles2]